MPVGITTIGNEGKRSSATFVVAASNSLHKERADCVCDGVDDQKQIQAAIDAMHNGGEIKLLEGQFNIGATINLLRSIKVIGTGAGYSIGETQTRLILADGANCPIFTLGHGAIHNCKNQFIDIALIGNSSGNTLGKGIYSDDSMVADTYISRVTIYDFKEHGIDLRSGWHLWFNQGAIEHCDDGIHLNNFSDAIISDVSLRSNNGIGFFSEFGKNTQINNCKIDFNDSKGIMIRTSNRMLITNNIVRENGTHGIGMYDAEDCIISNNFVDSNSRLANNTSDNIRIYDASSNNLVISNISRKGSEANKPKYGICIGGTNSANNIIIDNDLRLSGETSAMKDDGVATRYYDTRQDPFMNVLAVSATHVRLNEDLSEAIPNTFTITAQPDVPRTLSGHFDSHAQITAYTIVITGIDAKGNTVTETFTEVASPWDFETANAYATITSIIMTARTGTGAGDTMDIGITDVLGLSNIIYETSDVFKIKKNNANVAVATAQVNKTYDTYDMSVIGLGATDDFTIWYKSNLNIIS